MREIGARRPLHPSVIGSVIGTIGATAFVLANRGRLDDAWPVVAVVAWALLLAVAAWSVLLRRRDLTAPPAPARRAGLVYGASVLAMIGGMALGHAILVNAGHEDLQPAVIVLCVGLHFVPFAAAFHAPVFTVLGCSVAVIGVLGLVGGLAAGAGVASGAAVAAGLVMLAVIAAAAGGSGAGTGAAHDRA